ncbi:MAG: stage II sporulation protein P [Clostridiaceae bacterium]|nr:stage II sporulation protein P [Clostridiaceae bacterium]
MIKNKIGSLESKIVVALKILLFIFVALFAIKLGTIGGNMLYKSDMEIVKSLDVEMFRKTLNNSLPIIETIYNSGGISTSFYGQAKDLVKKVFHFELSRPVTILSAQSAVFYDYYHGDYQKYIAQKSGGNDQYISFADLEIENREVEKTEVGNEPQKLTEKLSEEPASSIAYNDDEEDRKMDNLPQDKVVSSGKIKINNPETDYKINIDELLGQPIKFDFSKKGPKVLIYHTHTTEGYLKNASELNKKGIPERTNDERYNVVRVGEELARILESKYKIDVIHNATVHNYPNDNVAYGKSLTTASNILKSYPSIQFVFDIHRDGVDDRKLRVVKEINKKNAAQVMFVVGTHSSKLNHPQWKENLKLAIKLQQKLNEKYPGLARPIFVSKNRYNQHLSNNSLIIEIGGDGNLVSECVESAKYVAEAINDVINDNK